MAESNFKLTITGANVHVGKASNNNNWLIWMEFAEDNRLILVDGPVEGKPITNILYDTREEATQRAHEILKLVFDASQEKVPVATFTMSTTEKDVYAGMVRFGENTWFLLDKKGAQGEHVSLVFSSGDEVFSHVKSIFSRLTFADPKIILHLIQDEPFIPSQQRVSPSGPSCARRACDKTCATRTIG